MYFGELDDVFQCNLISQFTAPFRGEAHAFRALHNQNAFRCGGICKTRKQKLPQSNWLNNTTYKRRQSAGKYIDGGCRVPPSAAHILQCSDVTVPSNLRPCRTKWPHTHWLQITKDIIVSAVLYHTGIVMRCDVLAKLPC